MSRRIVLLLSSPRVAPGLLSWPAWQLVTNAASQVYAGNPDHPQLPALHAAGVQVELLAGERDRRPDPDRIAEHLLAAAKQDDVAVWLSEPDGDPGLGEALGHRLLGRAQRMPELEILPGSYDVPGARLVDLVQVMDRLRRECPWVQGQTHRSLVRYLVEEAYETVEALEADDRTHLREELGDLLFQVVFHARLAEEYGDEQHAGDGIEQGSAESRPDQSAAPWSIDEVAADLTEKLVRRNPHVFSQREPAGPTGLAPDDIENVWDQLKNEEKGRASALEGVPPGLPALALADKLLERVGKASLQLPEDVESLLGQGIGGAAVGAEQTGEVTEKQLGQTLLAVVSAARRAGIDPEQALRDATRRLEQRVRAVEQEGD